jgi:hypothetical protein
MRILDIFIVMVNGVIFSLVATMCAVSTYQSFFHVTVNFWELWTIIISGTESAILAYALSFVRRG